MICGLFFSKYPIRLLVAGSTSPKKMSRVFSSLRGVFKPTGCKNGAPVQACLGCVQGTVVRTERMSLLAGCLEAWLVALEGLGCRLSLVMYQKSERPLKAQMEKMKLCKAHGL